MADIVDLVMNDPAFNKPNEVKQENTPKKKSKKK
jgi:hypothetical protein